MISSYKWELKKICAQRFMYKDIHHYNHYKKQKWKKFTRSITEAPFVNLLSHGFLNAQSGGGPQNGSPLPAGTH